MIDELAAKRFDRAEMPKDCTVAEALAKAAQYVAENGADHVVICFGKREEDGGSLHYRLQAGGYSHHESLGLLAQIQHDMMAG